MKDVSSPDKDYHATPQVLFVRLIEKQLSSFNAAGVEAMTTAAAERLLPLEERPLHPRAWFTY